MEKEKLINEIDQTVESIKSHINRIKNDHNQAHKLDVDLLIEKSRKLYDALINLDALIIGFDIETMEEIEQETITIKDEEEIDTIDKKLEEEKSEANELKEEKVHLPEKEIQVEKEIIEEEKVERTTEEKEEIEIMSVEYEDGVIEEKDEIQEKSTIDLFSTTGEPTLGDKLKTDKQPTVADKITKSTINELREAIGINEKFLFINELFNCDLNRYNKIIDELDQLPTLEGVNTYMLELKIQSQWADDNPALIKLTEMLHRKFIN